MASLTTDGISTTLGQYSGITADDIEGLLQSSAAYQNKTNAQNKITTIQSQENAWSAINTQLTLFQSKVDALESDDTYQTKTATSSNSAVATISGTTDAAEDSYSLIVKQLATATQITGDAVNVTSTKTALGISGTLTLTSPDADANGNQQTYTIDVDKTDTLKSIAQKINNLTDDTTTDGKSTQGSHIKASLIGNHMVLTSTTQGAKTIGISGNIAENIGLGSSVVNDKTKNIEGKNSDFVLDGMEFTKDTNNVSDVVDGTTFTLNSVSDSPVNLSLSNDTSKIVTAVQGMVSSYNSLMKTISGYLDVGDPTSSNNTTGALVGDNQLISLQSKLSNLASSITVSGTSMTANTVGISFTDRYGTLGVDTDKLQAAIKNDANAVKNFFYTANKSASGAVTLSSSGYSTDLDKLINQYLSGSIGGQSVIDIKNSGYQQQVKDLNSQIKQFDDTLEMQKEQYIQTFTQLDNAIMEGESQLSYFTNSTSTSSSSSK
ncbi:MAG: flagellar filament capping protein FliD [Liquorilactobacillus nagelii]|jgi:flagellar hook-associated protein 2|uniref:flagellar filament capping protein FliD n=1 Tax=Liquorilactobacillus nagelii TaxID=82688 RepID=UPI00242A3957|nr:flagellar filament capping protein FliD [Liquorilactobacillus nagelii]MCI1920817.1 flagellar filament capping protein FliD [Liquorilactobacillus nagelii]MCI1976851.1 flagellar filament capping protein FliD [Liquorilactobacillus nagelii]